MSTYVDSLNKLKNDVKVINLQKKKLMEQIKVLEEKIRNVVNSNTNGGVIKLKDNTLILTKDKVKHKSLKKVEKETAIKAVLQKYNIVDPTNFLNDMKNCVGEEIIVNSIEIKKPKVKG